MQNKKWLCLYYFVFILANNTLFAESSNNHEVKQFVANSLLKTFSIRSDMQNTKQNEIQKLYLDYAWQTMKDYLASYVSIVKNQNIQLHPYVKAKPIIIKEGPVAVGIYYWLVSIQITIPELNDNLQCLVTVIHNPAVPNRPYAIQSINVKKLD
jgi:hypothetical protein